MTSRTRVVCFGELLIRLNAPSHELLLQTPRLDVHYGGAEANVAVLLACLGHDVSMVSRIPDNALGRAALNELRRYGVDARHVSRGPGRMGLYFLTAGAVLRPSDIVYDRSDSAFARAEPASIDWHPILENAAWLHVSGVTPALGERSARACVRAVDEARRLGVKVSFDGNYRSKLWAAWDGDGPSILREILARADLAFINEKDVSMILGAAIEGSDRTEQRRRAARTAFESFPNLSGICSTFRVQQGIAHHRLSAVMFRRDSELHTREYVLEGIVDRIGAGDAFVAGLLHGLLEGIGDQPALDFAVAAATLKHSIPGDYCPLTVEEIRLLLSGDEADVKR